MVASHSSQKFRFSDLFRFQIFRLGTLSLPQWRLKKKKISVSGLLIRNSYLRLIAVSSIGVRSACSYGFRPISTQSPPPPACHQGQEGMSLSHCFLSHCCLLWESQGNLNTAQRESKPALTMFPTEREAELRARGLG